MTTLSGVRRLAGWWRILSEVADYLTRERLLLPRDPEPSDMRQAYAEYMDVQNDLSEILEITPALSGPQRIAIEDRNLCSFALPDGDASAFDCYGAHTISAVVDGRDPCVVGPGHSAL